jgi:hypothetical protein
MKGLPGLVFNFRLETLNLKLSRAGINRRTIVSTHPDDAIQHPERRKYEGTPDYSVSIFLTPISPNLNPAAGGAGPGPGGEGQPLRPLPPPFIRSASASSVSLHPGVLARTFCVDILEDKDDAGHRSPSPEPGSEA